MENEEINSAAMLIISAGVTDFPKAMKNEWINTTHVLLALTNFMFICSGAALVSVVFDNGENRVLNVFNEEELKEPISLKFEDDASEYKYNGMKLGISKDAKVVSYDIIEKRTPGDTKYKDFAKNYILTLERNGLNHSSLFAIARKFNPSLDKEISSTTIEGDLKTFFNEISKRHEMTAKLIGVKDIGELLFLCPAKYKYFEMLVSEKEANPSSLLDPLLLCTSLMNLFNEFKEPEDSNKVELAQTKKKLTTKEEVTDNSKDNNNKYNSKLVSSLDKNKYLINLNKALDGTPHSVYECDKYIERTLVELSKSHNNLVALVGPDGVGKKTIVKELVRNINEGNVPELFKGYTVYELNIDELCQLSANKPESLSTRLNSIFEELAYCGKAILFMDSPSNIIGSVQNQFMIMPGVQQGSDALINAAEKENIKCIITSTPSDYKKIESCQGLNNIIKVIDIAEPSDEVVFKIVKSKFEELSKGTDYVCPDKVINHILRTSVTWNPNATDPYRSIMLLEGTFAYLKIMRPADKEITENTVNDYLSSDSGLFVTENKAEATYKYLKDKLLNQDDALKKVYENLVMAECGFNSPKKPKAIIMLAGPTGVGKTETAKGIARAFYGSEKALVELNMAEYGDKMARSKLIGSSAGYIGYDDKPYLFREAEEKKQFVLLIDELDKTDQSVLDVLLRILDEGVLTDNKGNDVSFRNCIVVMTTNAGFDHNSNEAHGAGLVQVKAGTSNVEKALKNCVAPEFLSRISSYNIVKYNYLDDTIIDKLVERIRQEVLSTATIHNKDVPLDANDIAEIKKLADIKHYGARDLDNTVRLVMARKYVSMNKEENK